jgi:hypothetical protein
MKKVFICIIAITLIVFSGCRKKNKTCAKTATLLYMGFPECEFLVEYNNNVYEPVNMNEFISFVNYNDTQTVKIDFEPMGELPFCGGADRIQILCLSNP